MNFALNPMLIDIVITFILLLMLIFGYFKGFVYRAYDLLATVVSLLLAIYVSSPLSEMYKIYQVEGIGEIVGNVVNRFIIFILLFIVLKVISSIIGKFVKPLLKNIIHIFSVFGFLDHLLGAIVSLIEGTIMIYLALIFVITPVIPGGKENIEKTVIANTILDLVPAVTNEMKSLTAGLDIFTDLINEGIGYDSFDAANIVTIASSLSSAYDHGLVSQEELGSLLTEYYDGIEQPITLNQEQYNKVIDLLSKLDPANFDQTKILNKIVSE